MERDILVACGGLRDRAAIEGDLLVGGVGAGSKLVDNHAIDRDPALFNPLLGGPARGETGGGENFL